MLYVKSWILNTGFTRIRSVQNSRLSADIQAVELLAEQALNTVGELRAVLADITPLHLIEPEAWYQLGEQLPYTVDLSWSMSTTDGSYDVIFRRRIEDTGTKGRGEDSFHTLQRHFSQPWYTYANNPLQGKVNNQLVPQLQNYLQHQLPEYMIPSAFVLLDALPLTPNGKIDRRSLPNSHITGFEHNYVTARNSIEAKLVTIWSQILSVQQLGIHDNFFQLGGHSLLATGVMSRIRDVFQLEMPVRSLFEFPTIAQLAQKIKNTVESSLLIPPLHQLSAVILYPSSFAQQRLWFLSQLEPDSPLYNVPAAVRLTGL
jgi:acyl carrier protein